MARPEIEKILNEVAEKIYATSEEYRREVSDYEIHEVKISANDIEKQVIAEMKAREGGKDPTPATLTLIKTEVSEMCKRLYTKFDPSIYNNNRKMTLLSERQGTETNFSFVLATKPGKTANVFKTFKRAKQIAQRPLIKALNKKLKELNRGSKSERELINARKGFLDIGHDEESSVALQRAAKVNEAMEIIKGLDGGGALAQQVIKELDAQIKWQFNRDKIGPPKDKIGVSMESKALNRASMTKGEIDNLNKSLQQVCDRIGTEWATLEGSDSPVTRRQKKVLLAMKKPLEGNKNIKLKGFDTAIKESAKKASISVAKRKSTKKIFSDGKSGNTPKTSSKPVRRSLASSPLRLIGIINKSLPDVVRKNMQRPGLQNRTGRFAESVKLTDVIQTPKGMPSFGYTYAKNPYQVYEMGVGSAPWATPERDPRKLIDRSIREIAAQFALGRFYTRRV